MEAKNSWGKVQSTRTKVRRLMSICMVSFVIVSSVVLAFTLFAAHTPTHATPALNEYPTTDQPWGVSLDGHGHVWVAEPNCDVSPVCTSSATGLIARYSTSTPGSGKTDFTPTGVYDPVFLTEDANHNVWFTDPTHNAIGELTPSTNTWTEYAAPTANAAPYDLLIDKNGNIWFTEMLANKIGFFNPSTHTFTETNTPTAASKPYGITMDASGNIWFTENALPQIASFTPTTNGLSIAIHEAVIGSGANAPSPHLIATDTTGKVWYSEGFSGQVGVYDPTANTHTDYPVSAGVTQTHISGIGVDSNGLVWFNDSLSSRIGTLDPSTGKVTAIQLTFAGAHPHDGLAIDSSNNVWISEQYGYNLGEVLQNGIPTPTPTSTSTPPPTITPGPVNKTWYFAEGRVGGSYAESLTLNNPDPNNTCAVDVKYFYTPDGGISTTKSVTVTLAPASRVSESVNSDLSIPATQTSGADVGASLTISSSTPTCNGIVAERPLTFNVNGVNSGTDVIGATKLATTYYFADIPAKPSFVADIAILNPNNSAANITINYYAAGVIAKTKTMTVNAMSQGVFPQPGNLPKDSAAVITSSQPVVVERSDYFLKINEGNAGGITGAWSTVGSTSINSDWFFAQGYTAGIFQEYLAIANVDPANKTATVTITLEYATGTNQTFNVPVNANSQVLWDVNANVGTTPPSPLVSAQVQSSGANIVVEREMFFKYQHTVNKVTISTQGGTDVIGQPGPATYSSYSFAEGYTNTGYDELLVLQNPTGTAESITLTLVSGTGVIYSPAKIPVPAKGCASIDITSLVQKNMVHPGDPNAAYAVWMIVSDKSTGAYFVAERIEYWNDGATLPSKGATDVIGYYGA